MSRTGKRATLASWVAASLAVAAIMPATGWAGRAMQRPVAVVVSPDGRRVAAQDGEQIVIWNARGVPVARLASRRPFRGALARDALAAVFDQGLGVRSGKAYGQLVLLQRPPAVTPLRRVYLSGDAQVVAAIHPAAALAGDADAVTFWNAKRGAKLGMTRVVKGRRVLDVALASHGRTALICGDRQRQGAFCQLVRIRRRGVEVIGRWSSAALRTVYSVDMAPSAERAVVAAGDELLLFSLPSLRVVARQKVSALASLFPPRLQRLLTPFPPAHSLRLSPRGDEIVTFHSMRVVGAGRWAAKTLQPRAWLPRPRTLKGPIKQLYWGPAASIWVLGGAGGLTLERYRSGASRFEPASPFVLRPPAR